MGGLLKPLLFKGKVVMGCCGCQKRIDGGDDDRAVAGYDDGDSLFCLFCYVCLSFGTFFGEQGIVFG